MTLHCTAAKQHDQAAAAAAAAAQQEEELCQQVTATHLEQEEQQQQHATANMAWPLLLKHDSIRTKLKLVCTLLCCNKALAAAVAQRSAGQLDMPRFDTSAKAEQAAPWLRKHARLVRSLDLMYTPSTLDACVAAGPQSLLLQSLGVTATTTTLPLLEQLPSSRLTELFLRLYERPVQPQDRPAFVARVSAALSRLTALRSLELDRRERVASPLPGLAALTQLTALSLVGAMPDLQHAPPQLLEMRLDSYAEQQPLDLRHLAAATALSILSTPLREGDVLPPNLLRLQADGCGSVQPLLPLEQLQELAVRPYRPSGEVAANLLQQLSRLTALSLDHRRRFVTPASAGAWPALPLQRLELHWAMLSGPVCQHLAQLTGLTSLVLRSCQLPQAGSAQQLAAALRQLSGLQRLDLSRPLLAVAAPSTQEQQEEAAAGMRQLAQAVGSLQQLRDLDINGFQQLATAAGANSSSLVSMTALTGLSLRSCHQADGEVASIVSQLPGLQSLDCACNAGISCAAMPAIGRLQQLTFLAVAGTAVSDAGLQHLSGLTRLKHLHVGDTHVTDAGLCQLTCFPLLQELHLPRDATKQRQSWLQQHLPHLLAMWL